MAYVSGPVSTLPGAVFNFNHPYVECDGHEGVSAVVRVQGETDSFGAEYSDMCQACYDAYKARREEAKPEVQCCDFCDSVSDTVRPFRDPDEGSCGPVYLVCQPCRSQALAYYAD